MTPITVPQSKDVTRPPALAALGRRVPDRVSLDDPTTEAADAAIVTRSPAVAHLPAPFVAVRVPDPFELAEQVKPQLPPAAEPGLSPVAVNPPRPK